jgi:hypothetical protein
MQVFLLVERLTLAAVFLLAAGSKLATLSEFRRNLSAFGLRNAAAGPAVRRFE